MCSVSQHHVLLVEGQALKVHPEQSLKYSRESVPLNNLGLNISPFIVGWKIAIKRAFICIEYDVTMNFTVGIPPFWMQPDSVLLKSLDVGGIRKFVIVIVCTKAFICS